jgi:transposase InsO family protein
MIFKDIDACDACHKAKQKRLPFPVSISITHALFDLIHVDIWGPVTIPSFQGYRYFLTIVDDFTRFTWIYLMRLKSDVKRLLTSFITTIENQYSVTLKRIRSDNGKEFMLTDYYKDKGIIHETTCIETPQQNGIAERKHQHILNVGRALLFHSNLSKKFWELGIKHDVHIINMLPTPLLNQKSPFEKLTGLKPVLHDLRVFGCLAYCCTIVSGRKKFDSRSSKCILV